MAANKNGALGATRHAVKGLQKHAADFIASCISFAKALTLALVTFARGIQ